MNEHMMLMIAYGFLLTPITHLLLLEGISSLGGKFALHGRFDTLGVVIQTHVFMAIMFFVLTYKEHTTQLQTLFELIVMLSTLLVAGIHVISRHGYKRGDIISVKLPYLLIGLIVIQLLSDLILIVLYHHQL